MKFSAVTLVAVAAVASAQSIADIPACAQTCLLPALQATGCSLTDFKCSCSNAQFVSGSTACILKACSTADAEKAAKATYELCQSVGVTIHTEPIPGAGASTSAAAPATTSAAAAPATTSSAAAVVSSSAAAAPSYGAAPSSSAVSVHTTSAAAASSYVASAPSTIHTTCSTTSKAGNATAPTQAPPVQTGAGAVVVANAVLALGGAVAAFFL